MLFQSELTAGGINLPEVIYAGIGPAFSTSLNEIRQEDYRKKNDSYQKNDKHPH